MQKRILLLALQAVHIVFNAIFRKHYIQYLIRRGVYAS